MRKKTSTAGDEPPRLLFADEHGRIYDHPELLMVGRAGDQERLPEPEDYMPMPGMSRLFYLPACPPRGLDPQSQEIVTLRTHRVGKRVVHCSAVTAFLEPGYARTLLPAADTSGKDYVLPLWAYTAAGFKEGGFVACAFPVEDNPHWDPRNFDDREILPKIEARLQRDARNPLLRHLAHCATQHHCFAAKNLFLGRWEAPLPVSRRCNARCLGCLSHQPPSSCPAAHRRIAFRPKVDQIAEIAVPHLEGADDPIVSFGQGCEGEPLTEAPLMADAIREIRGRTSRGTVNLNTNGSLPRALRSVIRAGLDSCRISLNSARPRLFEAYVRPREFSFRDVERSLSLCAEEGLFTMINYLIFPGVSDQEEEWEALVGLIQRTGVHFIHFKNLCLDPDVYLRAIPRGDSPLLGIRRMARRLLEVCPEVRIGYFNQPVGPAPL
jgi:wyosine [tRNA(Phe)-imidazoG37] synthetase (radical SAM superfamily)